MALIMLPFMVFGMGWMFLVSGLINLRNKIFNNGNCPHGGSEGSLIEFFIIQSLFGIVTMMAFVGAFLYFPVIYVMFALIIWMMWVAINILIFKSEIQ